MELLIVGLVSGVNVNGVAGLGVSKRALWLFVGKSCTSRWSNNCLREMAAGKDHLVRGLWGARDMTLAVGI